MIILVYVRTKDGKRFRVSLEEWQGGADPLTVYNQRGIPVYLTPVEKRWSGVTRLARGEVEGLLRDGCQKL
jgi:hypothetical protein